MALTKNWAFALNTTPTDQSSLQKQCQSFWIQLKNFLVASGGWTVVASSDGTNYSGSTDLWGSTLAKCVWNVSGSARSWLLLKSPEGIVAGADGSYLGDQSRTYLCIDLAAFSSSAYYQCALIYHHEMPTGGSTTAVPTSPTSVSYAANTAYLGNTLISGSKFHFGVVSAGDGSPAKGQGAFYAAISNPTIAGISTYLSIVPMTNTQKGSATLDYAYATALKLVYSSTQNMFTGALYTAALGWNHDGTVASLYQTQLCLSNGNVIGTGTNSNGNGAGKNIVSTLFLYNATQDKSMVIGTIADFYITGATGLLNCIAAETGTVYHCFFQSNIWVPVNTIIIP